MTSKEDNLLKKRLQFPWRSPRFGKKINQDYLKHAELIYKTFGMGGVINGKQRRRLANVQKFLPECGPNFHTEEINNAACHCSPPFQLSLIGGRKDAKWKLVSIEEAIIIFIEGFLQDEIRSMKRSRKRQRRGLNVLQMLGKTDMACYETIDSQFGLALDLIYTCNDHLDRQLKNEKQKLALQS